MKKNITKILMAIALMAVFAAPSFADDVSANGAWYTATSDTYVNGDKLILDDTAPKGPGITFKDLKFSTGVSFIYKGADDAFTLATNNSKGTRTFATASNSSKMYVHVDDGQTVADSIPAAATNTSFASSTWTEVGK